MNRRVPLLYRYIFAEMLSPFLVALFVFTGILFLARSLKLIDLIVSKNASAVKIVSLFVLIIPQFLEIAIPMAMLLGIMLAFGRLSADSELVVMRATGISFRQLVAPVVAFASFGLFSGLLLAFYIRPAANHALAVGMFEIAKQQASSGLVAGIFNSFGNLTIYAEKVSGGGGQLQNVIIADRRDKPRDFIAKYGEILSDDETRALTVRLYNGSIQEGGGVDANITYFDINNITLNQDELLSDELGREGKKASEMTIDELLAANRLHAERRASLGSDETLSKKESHRAARFGVELHRRMVLPCSCFIVALIGMCLGVSPSRGGKTWGTAVNVTLGILVITAYYFSIAFATALGEQNVLAPWSVMWLPNVLFGAFALFIYRRIESEQWVAVSQALADLFIRLTLRFRSV